jgi:hypothetical protein
MQTTPKEGNDEKKPEGSKDRQHDKHMLFESKHAFWQVHCDSNCRTLSPAQRVGTERLRTASIRCWNPGTGSTSHRRTTAVRSGQHTSIKGSPPFIKAIYSPQSGFLAHFFHFSTGFSVNRTTMSEVTSRHTFPECVVDRTTFLMLYCTTFTEITKPEIQLHTFL